MKFLCSISLLASLASAASIGRRDSPLDIQLEMVSNTGVQATITNIGNEDLKIFKTGTFLDSAPVEKVQVFKGG
jgi:deuterolysin